MVPALVGAPGRCTVRGGRGRGREIPEECMWTCAHCGEENVGRIPICVQCGRMRVSPFLLVWIGFAAWMSFEAWRAW